jgi:sugar phosphate isomerase/epimerase
VNANLWSLLESKDERRRFLSVLEQNGLSLAALYCSGNQLHPVEGKRHSEVVYDTVRVAELLGVDTIVLMSGLPAGGPNDVRPNWITFGSRVPGPWKTGRFKHALIDEPSDYAMPAT